LMPWACSLLAMETLLMNCVTFLHDLDNRVEHCFHFIGHLGALLSAFLGFLDEKILEYYIL